MLFFLFSVSYKEEICHNKEPEEKQIIAQVKQVVLQRFTILNWLPKYGKNDAIGDLIAGITVGLTLMPQSIAYASLATLSPQVNISFYVFHFQDITCPYMPLTLNRKT
jgi:Sulfate permease and related transporters (MFS superfamily)